MATFTASELTSQPKEVHVGLVSKSSTITVGVTGTASSVFKLVRVPDGATIVDWIWFAEDASDTPQYYKLGLRLPLSDTETVTESALAADVLVGYQNFIEAKEKLPYKVSFTVNAIQRFAWVEAVAVNAISASAVHRFTLIYTMDGS